MVLFHFVWFTTRYGMALIHADIWMIWRLGFLNIVSLYSEAVDAIYIYILGNNMAIYLDSLC